MKNQNRLVKLALNGMETEMKNKEQSLIQMKEQGNEETKKGKQREMRSS